MCRTFSDESSQISVMFPINATFLVFSCIYSSNDNAVCCHKSHSSSIQVMAYCLVGTKPDPISQYSHMQIHLIGLINLNSSFKLEIYIFGSFSKF